MAEAVVVKYHLQHFSCHVYSDIYIVKSSLIAVDKLGVATMYIGRQVAPHLRKQGEKYLPASFKKDTTDGRSKVDNVMEVAAGGLLGETNDLDLHSLFDPK